jgi:serine/threonine-protein kinase
MRCGNNDRPVSSKGTTVEGKYRLTRLIKRGEMGEVWEANHLNLELKVAVKLLTSEAVRDPVARARFIAEAKASGFIGHDNICEVLDFGSDEQGALYFAMPLLRGRSLREEIRQGGPISFARACDIASQTLAGLSAAHTVGIVHRDLKPENIFLTSIGDREDFVKIMDFGVAKLLAHSAARGEHDLTKEGMTLGTPIYMAPEQTRGLRDIDGRIDVYSTGLVLYEMLTCVQPFRRDALKDIIWAIWNAPIDPPRKYRPDIPPALEEVILRAMSRDRAERYPSADAMSHALGDGFAQARSGLGPQPTLETACFQADPDREEPVYELTQKKKRE